MPAQPATAFEDLTEAQVRTIVEAELRLRAAVSAARTGATHSPEIRRRMSESQRRRWAARKAAGTEGEQASGPAASTDRPGPGRTA